MIINVFALQLQRTVVSRALTTETPQQKPVFCVEMDKQRWFWAKAYLLGSYIM